jgi:hypothetical protein
MLFQKKKKIKDLKILKELKKKSEILLQQMNFSMLHKNLCFCYFNTFCFGFEHRECRPQGRGSVFFY